VSRLTEAQMREFMAANDFQSPDDIQRALKALCAETLPLCVTLVAGRLSCYY
jgi:hypothetical protein